MAPAHSKDAVRTDYLVVFVAWILIDNGKEEADDLVSISDQVDFTFVVCKKDFGAILVRPHLILSNQCSGLFVK